MFLPERFYLRTQRHGLHIRVQLACVSDSEVIER